MVDVLKAFFNGLAQSILAVIESMGVSSDILGVISNMFNNALG